MTHQSKNLFNICNWLVRQVVSAYEYDRDAMVSRLKSDAHPNQIEAIAHFNRQIDDINRKRAEKHPARVKKARLEHGAAAAVEKGDGKEFEAPKLKVLARLEPVMASPLGAVTDLTVLDNAAKTRANEGGDFVYRRIPAAMAQQVVRRLRECYSGYLQATKRFNADPTNMTGLRRSAASRPFFTQARSRRSPISIARSTTSTASGRKSIRPRWKSRGWRMSQRQTARNLKHRS